MCSIYLYFKIYTCILFLLVYDIVTVHRMRYDESRSLRGDHFITQGPGGWRLLESDRLATCRLASRYMSGPSRSGPASSC